MSKELLDLQLSVEEYKEHIHKNKIPNHFYFSTEDFSLNSIGYALSINNINYLKAFSDIHGINISTVIGEKKKNSYTYYAKNMLLVDFLVKLEKNSQSLTFINQLALSDKFYQSSERLHYSGQTYYNEWFFISQIKEKNQKSLYYYYDEVMHLKGYTKTFIPFLYKNLSVEELSFIHDFYTNVLDNNINHKTYFYKNSTELSSLFFNNYIIYNIVKTINSKNTNIIKEKLEFIFNSNTNAIQNLQTESLESSLITDKAKLKGKNTPVFYLIKENNYDFINFFIQHGYKLNDYEINLIQLNPKIIDKIDEHIPVKVNNLSSNIILFEKHIPNVNKKVTQLEDFFNNLPANEKQELFDHYYNNYKYYSMSLSLKAYSKIKENVSCIDHYLFNKNFPVLETLIKNGFHFNKQQQNFLFLSIFTSYSSEYENSNGEEFFLDFFIQSPLKSKKDFLIKIIHDDIQIIEDKQDIFFNNIKNISINPDLIELYLSFEKINLFALNIALNDDSYHKDEIFNILKIYFLHHDIEKSNFENNNHSLLFQTVFLKLYQHNQKQFEELNLKVPPELLSKFEKHILIKNIKSEDYVVNTTNNKKRI